MPATLEQIFLPKTNQGEGGGCSSELDPKWPRFGRSLHIYRYYLRQNEQICWPLSNRFSPHESECVGIGTGYTLIGSLALVSPC